MTNEEQIQELKDQASIALMVLKSPDSLEDYERARAEYYSALIGLKELGVE